MDIMDSKILCPQCNSDWVEVTKYSWKPNGKKVKIGNMMLKAQDPVPQTAKCKNCGHQFNLKKPFVFR